MIILLIYKSFKIISVLFYEVLFDSSFSFLISIQRSTSLGAAYTLFGSFVDETTVTGV